jgi:uncharacterized membrane protein (TIGR02234 family)
MADDGVPATDQATARATDGRSTADRRSYVRALAALAGGGGLALAAAQATWVTSPAAGVGFSTSFTGSDLAPAVVACALVSIAGAVAVIATRGLVRRLLGVLLAVVSMVLVVGPARVLADPSGAARQSLARVAVGAADAAGPATTAWWWCALAAVGGAAVFVGSVSTLLHGRSWPVMAARYEAPAGGRGTATTPDAWAQLDRGQDPTVDTEVDEAAPASDGSAGTDPTAATGGQDLQE